MNLQISRKTLFTVGGALVGVVLLVAVVHWLHRPVHATGKTDVSPFENDMMESLVRSVLHESAVSNAPVCFLAFGEAGTSPSDSFIARFADCHRPAVCSARDSVSPPIHGYFDKANGHAGIIVQIIKLETFASGIFDVTVTISSLPAGHNQIVYRVSDVGAEWVITKRTAT